MGLKDNYGVLFVIMTLITLGGLGFSVLHEIWSRLRGSSIGQTNSKPRAFSLHSRVVLWVSTVLVVGGTFLLIGFGLTPDENSWVEKIVGGLFQSVTARTAGFNSVDIGKTSFRLYIYSHYSNVHWWVPWIVRRGCQDFIGGHILRQAGGWFTRKERCPTGRQAVVTRTCE